jgi:hypothetical protein
MAKQQPRGRISLCWRECPARGLSSALVTRFSWTIHVGRCDSGYHVSANSQWYESRASARRAALRVAKQLGIKIEDE